MFYSAFNDSAYSAGDYGSICKVVTGGNISERFIIESNTKIPALAVSDTNEILIVTKVFIEEDRDVAFTAKIPDLNFDEELLKHTLLHKEIYGKVDFCISDSDHSNEELLLEAYDKGSSNELIEKLYAFGRYLFVCSTAEKDSLPCHLIGLWNGSYNCHWAFNMYNINLEMIYWQALTGNMPKLLKLALDYTESMLDDFKENAKKLYGCRGIFINSVNTPESGISKCMANHILNWTVGGAWISQHFWDYCMYTNDVDYMKNHALPFMYQAALFFEDFLVEDDCGYYVFSPSVSPENTALNIINQGYANVETSVNATMDIALLKELLTNLLKGCALTGLYQEKLEKWTDMLKKLPDYQINEDGAIKEWTHDFYKDNYHHRHLSHIYPLFPGKEITKESELFPNFVEAVKMRLEYGLSDQTSWSMIFIAGMSSRMGDGEQALLVIDTLARVCLMNNFFTVHNDWRRTGPVSCDDMRIAPFQIDGNIGIPAAINEMLLFSNDEKIEILPALPKKWKQGHIKGLLAVGNIVCDIVWSPQNVKVNFTCKKGLNRRIIFNGQEKQIQLGVNTELKWQVN